MSGAIQQITFAPAFSTWQRAARSALRSGLPPEQVHWQELSDDQPTLAMFEEAEEQTPGEEGEIRVPRAYPPLAKKIACHRDPLRWDALYRVLWRLTHGERQLLEVVSDPDVIALLRMEKAVRHDMHKMRAFVRFREVQHEGGPWFVAWFEPEHHIVEANAAFFVDRFASMRWAILTPDRCAHWDGSDLSITPGVSRAEAPTGDAVESLWRDYYSHIFNPARLKTRAMQREMPKKYWKNLPEAGLIPALVHEASSRMETMIAKSDSRKVDAVDWHPAEVPPGASLDELRAAAGACTACPLYKTATQTVFGEGPRRAQIVFLGEQPGDQEDRAGQPFIGPAGQLLNRALVEAGIDRDQCYVTNTVKHFKWEQRGKRRLHQTPNSRDIAACRPWMEAELKVIKPKVLVCLGGTAAKAIFGPAIRVTQARGNFMETPWAAKTLVTVHPSSLLRAPDEATRQAQYALFLADLRVVAEFIGG